MQMNDIPLYRALHGEVVDHVEMVVAVPGRVPRRIVASGRALFDGDGRKLGAVVGMHDITEHVAANERFRVLFEFSSHPHLLFDEAGIIDCNDATIRILGCLDKAQVLALHPAVLSPEIQPDGRRSMEKCIEMDRLGRERGQHRFEWTHRRMDGMDPQGQPRGMGG